MRKTDLLSKISLLAVVLAVISTSCNDNKDKNRYTVTAYVPDQFNGQTVYLFDPEVVNGRAIDSTVIKDGIYRFEGIPTDTPAIRIARYGDVYPATFVNEKGDIRIAYGSLTMVPSVEGSPLNNTYQAYLDSADILFRRMRRLYDRRNEMEYRSNLSAEQKAVQHASEKDAKENLENLAYNYIKANSGNVLGKVAFYNETLYISPEKQKELFPLFDNAFRQTPQFIEKEALINAQIATQVGNKYANVNGLDPKGSKVSLSDYVGKKKFVIVDFWASWCKPCVKTIPHLKVMYDEFKDQGLEIVSISLDEDKDIWTKAIDIYGMKWPQMTNLKGWNEPAAIVYGINNLPELIIIDKEGNIVARGLRGGQLQDKIDELMNYKIPLSPLG